MGALLRSRLWLRLTGAFALIIAAAILVTVLLARSGAATQFEHFMAHGQMVRPALLQQVLADHYYHHGGWSHTQEMLPTLLSTASDGAMSGMMGSMIGMHENHLLILDGAGRVVGDSLAGDSLGGDPLAGDSLAGDPVASDSLGAGAGALAPPLQRWPVVVNGEEVGALVVQGALMGPAANPNLLLGSMTRTVLLAAAAGGVVALVLSALVVRQITQPLDDLSRAAQRISAGDLSARVPVQGEDEIGALAQSFNQMAGGLQQQEQLRRSLVADVAHELRTPLTGIQGAVEAMQDGIFPADAENLGALHDEVMLLNRLVDDLRTLANAEAGQLTLQCRHFDIADLCRRQASVFQFGAQARRIALAAEIAPSVPPVYADEQRIGQVLHILVDNALRHCQEGSTVTVTCTAALGPALGPASGAAAGAAAGAASGTAAAANGVRSVTVTVTDDGPGVAQADLDHVFDRFYRADRSRSRAGGGTGLGLAIARQLLLAHGGDIWVQSPPPGEDRGAVFGFTLPAAPAADLT
jgi:two-component system OmpR family sensor kinase/two-component system sensor histidine kinase BaeS